jgi:RNA polymerase sporulation-specific sigma factor
VVSGLFLATALSFLQGIVFLLAGYISNNAFPRPLSEEDEAIFLRRLDEGDEEARNILIEHNLRLVAHIIKKFDGVGEDADDLISIGTIGLIKAINTFNTDRGTITRTCATTAATIQYQRPACSVASSRAPSVKCIIPNREPRSIISAITKRRTLSHPLFINNIKQHHYNTTTGCLALLTEDFGKVECPACP